MNKLAAIVGAAETTRLGHIPDMSMLGLQADAALDEFRFQHIHHLLQSEIAVGFHADTLFLAVKLHLGIRSLEVVALLYLLQCLVDGVVDLLKINC